MTIGENIEKVRVLTEKVKTHCMCLDFSEDKYHYMVIFPEGFRIDGVRAEKAMGKIKALEKLIEKMEYYWYDELPESFHK